MYNYKESVICTLIKAKYVTKFNLSISAVVNEYHDQRYVYGIDVDENIIKLGFDLIHLYRNYFILWLSDTDPLMGTTPPRVSKGTILKHPLFDFDNSSIYYRNSF